MTILNERCVICNKVSSELIETEIGDFVKKKFFRDDMNPNQSICEECKEAHEELMFDYIKKDNVWGWDEKSGESPYIVDAANDNPKFEEIILLSDLKEHEDEPF